MSAIPRDYFEKKLDELFDVGHVVKAKRARKPVEILVATIISQNSSDRNTALAMERLKRRFKMSEEALASAPLEELEEAIRPAGLYREKARYIRRACSEIAERFGSLEKLLAQGYERAREGLMSIKGVGEKTADVVIAFSGVANVLPVDRHIMRVAKRLGLVDERAGYYEVRRALEELFEGSDLAKVHLQLIQFGREICRAAKPKCGECFLRGYCKHARGVG